MMGNKFELGNMEKIFLYRYQVVYDRKDEPIISEAEGIILLNENNDVFQAIRRKSRMRGGKESLPILDPEIERENLYNFLDNLTNYIIEVGPRELQFRKKNSLFHVKPIEPELFNYSDYYNHFMRTKEGK